MLQRFGGNVWVLYRSDEAIPAPVQRFDKFRAFGSITKRRAETFDRGVHAVFEVHERAVGPQPIPNFLPRDHVSSALEQHGQNLEWLLLKSYAHAILTQFTRT